MPQRKREMSLNRKRLKEAREKVGLSQRKLSLLCEFGETEVNRYERDKKPSDPSASHLTKIAQQLHVSSDWLLGLSDEPLGQLSPGENGLTDDHLQLIRLYDAGDFMGVSKLIFEKLAKQKKQRDGE